MPRNPAAPNASTDVRKRPRQDRSAATFDAIVEAAARILASEGPRRLTTNRIAGLAGVSVGSLYQYFPNKRAIVRALLERELARAEGMRPAALDDASKPLAERIRAAVDWHFDVHASRPELARALRMLVRDALPEELRAELLRHRAARVRQTIAEPVAASGRDPDQVGFVLDVCLDSLTDATAARRPDWLTSEALRDEVAILLTRYLEA